MKFSDDEKPKLVLVHGWGMSEKVWDDLVPRLFECCEVTRVSLPGHGHLQDSFFESEAQVCDALVAQAPVEPAIWLGWSFGGMLTMKIAELYPERVKSLILVAVNLAFTVREGWDSAMPLSDFVAFESSLKKDAVATLRRFIALQFSGARQAKADIRQFRQGMAGSEPSGKVLIDSLLLLKSLDLRGVVARLRQPVLLLQGEEDVIVPKSAARAFQTMRSDIQLEIMKNAGHAPFFSHPALFSEYVCKFVSNGTSV